jgi:hypothetical protein
VQRPSNSVAAADAASVFLRYTFVQRSAAPLSNKPLAGCGNVNRMKIELHTLHQTAVVALVCAVLGCSEAYEQAIRGHVMDGNKPAAFLPVRFISSGAEDNCDLPGAEAITDRMGRFEVRQTYKPSALESLAVVIHPYRLCVQKSGHWERIWHETTGPAPTRLELECQLAGEAECGAGWNGRAVRPSDRQRAKIKEHPSSRPAN